MKTLLAAVAIALSGCTAALHNTAVYSESALRAGSLEWTAYTDEVVAKCRQTSALSEDTWEACVGPTRDLDSKISIGLSAAVAALRMYWTAAAMGDREGMLGALHALSTAVASLPPGQFGGVQKILNRLPRK